MNDAPPSSQRLILVADDDAESLRAVARALLRMGHRVLGARDGREAMDLLDREAVDAVVTDLRMPGTDGMDLLRAAVGKAPPVPVVIMTGYGTVESAVEAMKLDAIDYLQKPVDLQDLRACVDRALSRRAAFVSETEVGEVLGLDDLLGTSAAMRAVFRQIRQVAPFRTTVLLTGESGAGKELVARSLHRNSPRRGEPFVPVNCSTLPKDLVESQLFGHERGAFTGASSAHRGFFEVAQEGTLFLDEIGDLAAEAQSKLLRALEEREIVRVGGTQPIRVDVRLIAATNADLEAAVRERRFREELFYRLNVVAIRVPPLRERREDIPLLVRLFLDRFARENNVPAKQFHAEAMGHLVAHAWPGNVRELKNVVERLAVTVAGEILRPDDLPEAIRKTQPAPLGGEIRVGMSMEEIEQEIIRQTLAHTGGNRTKAADILGIGLRTLQRKLKQYNIS